MLELVAAAAEEAAAEEAWAWPAEGRLEMPVLLGHSCLRPNTDRHGLLEQKAVSNINFYSNTD